jgi:hypothetical protein
MPGRYSITPHSSLWCILEHEGIKGTPVAWATTEEMATRIAGLLERHGVVDVPMDGLVEP